MSPTGVVIVLVLGFVIDYMSAGPDSLRDRAAFLLALAGFRDGFNNSPADEWTVEQLGALINSLLDQTKGAYIAGASINAIVGAGVGILAIYAVGCLVPDRMSKRMGRWATLSFSRSGLGKVNWKLWIMAFLLGVLADLGQGLVGNTTETAVEALTWLVAPLPLVLFGAA